MDAARSFATPRWPWLAGAGYAAMLLAVISALVATRRWALVEFATTAAVADWQDWREQVRQQQQRPGPVERRVPQSAEPPALMLLRDHFTVLLVAAVVLSSLLYWTLAWFVAGMTRAPPEPTGEPVA